MGKALPRLPHLFVALHLLYEVSDGCAKIAIVTIQRQAQTRIHVRCKTNTYARAGLQIEYSMPPPSRRPSERLASSGAALET